MIPASTTYTSYLTREVIYPKFKLLSYDLSLDTWSEIIAGTAGQTPTDLSGYVTSIDYTYDRLSVKLADTSDLHFHPDGGDLRGVLASGRAVRLLEGFEGLDEAEWLWTFSGQIEGTYAWSLARAHIVEATFTVYNRGNNQAWKLRNVTSRNYTVGSDWSTMFVNIVQDIMFLEPNEVAVPSPWQVLFDKNTNQVVNYPPWDAITQLMWGFSAVPWFNGKGQLDYFLLTQDRTTQVLPTDQYIASYDARDGGTGTINKVILTYISNTLSRIDGKDQILASAIITAGFLLNSQSQDCYYSDERTIRSDNPRLIVRQSVNQTFLEVGSESMTKFDEFHSRVDVDVPLWAGFVLLALLAAYITIAAGANFLGDLIGAQLAMALILVTILLFMSTIGTGQYEVWGTPYEYVYLEQKSIAIKADTAFWQERTLELRNDFISTDEQAGPLVLTQLHYEVMKEQPRTLILRYDPRIEPGDIIELSSSVRFYTEQMKRTIRRGTADVLLMNVDGYRTAI